MRSKFLDTQIAAVDNYWAHEEMLDDHWVPACFCILQMLQARDYIQSEHKIELT